MTDKNHQQALDRLGQRTFFHSDFKGRNHDNVCPSMVRGIDYIRDPRLNKVTKQKPRNQVELNFYEIRSSFRAWLSLWPRGKRWASMDWFRHASRPRKSRLNFAWLTSSATRRISTNTSTSWACRCADLLSILPGWITQFFLNWPPFFPITGS